MRNLCKFILGLSLLVIFPYSVLAADIAVQLDDSTEVARETNDVFLTQCIAISPTSMPVGLVRTLMKTGGSGTVDVQLFWATFVASDCTGSPTHSTNSPQEQFPADSALHFVEYDFTGEIGNTGLTGTGSILFQLNRASGFSNDVKVYQNAGATEYYYEFYDTDGPEEPITDFTTRIDSVIPPNNSTVATSTSFEIGATGYVNVDDLADETTLTISFQRDACASASLVGPTFALDYAETCIRGSLVVPLTDGAFDVASSTYSVLGVGRYSLNASITVPRYTLLGFDFGTRVLVSTSTRFLVATSTKFDLLNDQVTAEFETFFDDTSASCEIDFTTAFSDLKTCIAFLFAFSGEQVVNGIKTLADAFLTHVPWGYAYRVFIIFTSEEVAPATLPSIAAEIPDGLPVVGSFDFTPWAPITAALEDLTEIESTNREGSILDEFAFYWASIWYILFGLWATRKIFKGFSDNQHYDHSPRYRNHSMS